jgi:hypothetical protein
VRGACGDYTSLKCDVCRGTGRTNYCAEEEWEEDDEEVYLPGDPWDRLELQIRKRIKESCFRCSVDCYVFKGNNPEFAFEHGVDVLEGGTTAGPEPCGAAEFWEVLEMMGVTL